MSGWVDRREKADDAEKRIMKIRRYHQSFRVRELTIRTIEDGSGECIAIRRGAEGQERLVGGYQEDLRTGRGGQRRRGVLRRSASGFSRSLGLGTARLRQAGKDRRGSAKRKKFILLCITQVQHAISSCLTAPTFQSVLARWSGRDLVASVRKV